MNKRGIFEIVSNEPSLGLQALFLHLVLVLPFSSIRILAINILTTYKDINMALCYSNCVQVMLVGQISSIFLL